MPAIDLITAVPECIICEGTCGENNKYAVCVACYLEISKFSFTIGDK